MPALWGVPRVSAGDAPVPASGDAYGRSSHSDEKPRCWRCNRLLAVLVTRPWAITCTRCKAQNAHE